MYTMVRWFQSDLHSYSSSSPLRYPIHHSSSFQRWFVRAISVPFYRAPSLLPFHPTRSQIFHGERVSFSRLVVLSGVRCVFLPSL